MNVFETDKQKCIGWARYRFLVLVIPLTFYIIFAVVLFFLMVYTTRNLVDHNVFTQNEQEAKKILFKSSLFVLVFILLWGPQCVTMIWSFLPTPAPTWFQRSTIIFFASS